MTVSDVCTPLLACIRATKNAQIGSIAGCCPIARRSIALACLQLSTVPPVDIQAHCLQDVVAHRGKLLIYKRPGQRVLINSDGFMQVWLR